MGLLPTTRSYANDLLRKGECLIGEDILMQRRSEADRKSGSLLNVKTMLGDIF